jgi:hypothetical protein
MRVMHLKQQLSIGRPPQSTDTFGVQVRTAALRTSPVGIFWYVAAWSVQAAQLLFTWSLLLFGG